MNSIKHIFFLIICLAISAGAGAKEQEHFDAYVENLMKRWDVPGASIAVIKDGQIVTLRGYGVKEKGSDSPVDENTVFAIGSCSKAFTAAGIALLVEEGKMNWDAPVIDYLPEFKVADPQVTSQITIRDALCHRCGFQRHDLAWYHNNISSSELIQKMQFLEQDWPFRSKWGYNNLMYLVVGECLSRVTNTSWEQYIKTHLLKPLNMQATYTSMWELDHLDNVATPHINRDNQAYALPWADLDTIAPAGAIKSNAADMAQWVKMLLNKGNVNGTQFLSETTIEEMFAPEIEAKPGTYYGLAWFTGDYFGHRIVEHDGSIDGMRALVTLVPEENLGLVVLVNSNPSLLPYAIKMRLLHDYFGMRQMEWASLLESQMQHLIEQALEQETALHGLPNPSPTQPLENYLGHYTSNLYPDLTIEERNGSLYVNFTCFEGNLEHFKNETFSFDLQQINSLALPGKLYFTFDQNSLLLEGFDFTITFTRTHDAQNLAA